MIWDWVSTDCFSFLASVFLLYLVLTRFGDRDLRGLTYYMYTPLISLLIVRMLGDWMDKALVPYLFWVREILSFGHKRNYLLTGCALDSVFNSIPYPITLRNGGEELRIQLLSLKIVIDKE